MEVWFRNEQKQLSAETKDKKKRGRPAKVRNKETISKNRAVSEVYSLYYKLAVTTACLWLPLRFACLKKRI